MRISDWSSDVCSSDLYIERSASDLAIVQRLLERFLVDQPAPRAIDDADALLRPGEILAREDVARLVGKRSVEGDEIGTGEKFIQGHLLDAKIDRPFDRQEGDRKSTRLNSTH